MGSEAACLLHRFGPMVFISVHLSTGLYGLLVAMPRMYQSEEALLIMQIIGCIGLGQVLICWYITKKTDSSYHPSVPFSIPKLEHEIGVENDSNFILHNEKYSKRDIDNFIISMPSKVARNGESTLSYGSHDALSFKLSVATNVNGFIEKKAFPYWSWIPCFTCQIFRPPRCHHCPMCKKCILKRDHHCFFTGTCIGVRNQGHFILLTFWGVFITTFGTIHMLMYTYFHILPIISYIDFLPPISLVRMILGYIPFFIPLVSILFWALLIFTVLSIAMCYEILNVTARGVTSFEIANKIKIIDCRSLRDRWCDVLGDKWLLSILIPWRISDKEREEDALFWPHIKP